MHTVKSLYDTGQVQFPMRGGGISPRIELYNNPNSDKHLKLFTFAGTQTGYWDLNGYYFHHWGGSIENPFDLLPIPLPNLESENARINSKLEKLNEVCAPILAKLRYPHELKTYSELLIAVSKGITSFEVDVDSESDSDSIWLSGCVISGGVVYCDLAFSFSVMGGEEGVGCIRNYKVPGDLIVNEKGGYKKDDIIKGKVTYEDHTSMESIVCIKQQELHALKDALSPDDNKG